MRNTLTLALFLFVVGAPLCAQSIWPVSIVNGEQNITLSQRTTVVNLAPKPFVIHYLGKAYDSEHDLFYSAKIAVLINPNDTLLLNPGQSIKNIPFFEPGKGMAPAKNGRYDWAHITNQAHHYLFYENEQNNRVTLTTKTPEGLWLQWPVKGFIREGKRLRFSAIKSSVVYLVIFRDNNLNDTIDENELVIVQLCFI